jgi:hypothetical protein
MVPYVAEMTLEALADGSYGGFEFYRSLLCDACERNPPPFGQAWYGEKYRDLAVDPLWLAESLVANASKEGEGSRKLWDLVSRISDSEIREKVRIHAIDESRHAKFYLAMLDIVFPKAVDEALRPVLDKLSPGYRATDFPEPTSPSSDEIVLDEIIQMNIGEIRTRIHQLLLRPIISEHCSEDAKPKLQKILNGLLDDETRHIAYTAKIIEDKATTGMMDFLTKTMAQRVADFNEITLQEVASETFEGG